MVSSTNPQPRLAFFGGVNRAQEAFEQGAGADETRCGELGTASLDRRMQSALVASSAVTLMIAVILALLPLTPWLPKSVRLSVPYWRSLLADARRSAGRWRAPGRRLGPCCSSDRSPAGRRTRHPWSAKPGFRSA